MVNHMYKIEENKIILSDNSLFEIIKPIEFGSHSNIYKARLGTEMYAIKKYTWLFEESLENIERNSSIIIDSYITPLKILYIKDKFEGYLMKFCKGKDLSKRKLDISIDEFATNSVKLLEDTDRLSELNYYTYDTYITNIMYDDGFKMVDTDEYIYNPNYSQEELKNLNRMKINKLLSEIFIKNAGLANLYFNNVDFQKLIDRCKEGEILFEELFNILCVKAYNSADYELEKVSDIGKVMRKLKK